jgi:hypothetical protein
MGGTGGARLVVHESVVVLVRKPTEVGLRPSFDYPIRAEFVG